VLPRALRAWAPLLADLPAPVATAVIPWLAPAERLLSPFLAPRLAPTGPPDGFGALARRGPYERLLLSEWLLFQEIPDEFMRRAAGGEHLFQAVVRKQPAARRQAVVLFDVGPWQLGAPRLAQIALLVVFARRAATGGTSLAWGALQHPEHGLRTAVDAVELRRFLGWRTERPVDDEHRRSWRAAIAGGPAGAETDLWTVGPPGPLAGGDRFHIEIREPEAPGPSELTLRVAGPGRTSTRISLPLPPATAQVAVLRDLTEAAERSEIALLDAGAVAFAPSGQRLLVRPDERTVEAWFIPARPELPSTRRRFVLPEGETFLAAGWHRKTFVVVAAAGSDLLVHGIGRLSGLPMRRFPGAATSSSSTVGLLGIAWVEPRLRSVWFIDGERFMRRLDVYTGRAERVAPRVLAAIQAAGKMVYLLEDGGGRIMMRVWDAPDEEQPQHGPHRERPVVPPSYLGGRAFMARASGPRGALFAYPRPPRAWRVGDGRSPAIELRPSAGSEVMGVTWLRREPALLVCEGDGHTLALVGRRHVQPVLVADGPVRFAATNPYGREIVVVTDERLSVVDRGGRVLLACDRRAGGAR
jgi:hypothetical protein